MKAALVAGFAAILFLKPVGSFAQSLPAPAATVAPAQAVPKDTPAFTVPDGWTSQPVSFAMNGFTMLNTWTAPPTLRRGDNLSLGFVPAPGATLQDMAQAVNGVYQRIFGAGNPTASHAERLCNGRADGWYFENKVVFGALSVISEQTMILGPSDAFEATYTRDSSEKEDTVARKALDSLCVKPPA